MTEPDLIAAGYREYRSSAVLGNADRFYQKTVRSPDGRLKLYFINVNVYDFRKYEAFPKDQDPIRFEAESHLYRDADRSYRLYVPVNESDSVADIEAEFARAYEALGCVPDVHNNDGE